MSSSFAWLGSDAIHGFKPSVLAIDMRQTILFALLQLVPAAGLISEEIDAVVERPELSGLRVPVIANLGPIPNRNNPVASSVFRLQQRRSRNGD
jgi:hypothetical protein